jgi:hypothetical protein
MSTLPNDHDPGPHRSPDTHPLWCLRQGCTERGWHASRPLTAGQPDDLAEPVTVQLVQLVAPHTEPGLTIATAGTEPLTLTIRQARILRRFLGRLVELATR